MTESRTFFHKDLYNQYFQKLTRDIQLKDDKGLTMPAMKVFTEGIRYLKDHLLKTCEADLVGLEFDEVHWVLTVPAIWDDSAKQFMREAAIEVILIWHKLQSFSVPVICTV